MTATTARMIIENGALPLDTDFLNLQRFFQAALAQIIAGTIGTATAVDGFTCIPTAPATLNVQVTPGSMFALEQADATSFGSLSADTTALMKVGTLANAQTFAITPPGTGGYSQCFLVQATFSEADGVPVVLQYFNSSNIMAPLNGPGGTGVAQNTQRICSAVLTLKAGIAASTGTQVSPAPDPGNVGLFVVTVANGALSVTSGNIATYASAPFIPVKLPALPSVIQGDGWSFGLDTGSVNAIIASVAPTPSSLTAGFRVSIKITNSNTGPTTLKLNGIGPTAVKRTSGAALGQGNLLSGMIADFRYDGTNWQLLNPAPDPVGMKTVFFQATAPLGWTQDTTYNDFAMRIVSGTGGGVFNTGQAFSSAVASGTVNGHAITITEMPSHSHGVTDPTHSHTVTAGNLTAQAANGGNLLMGTMASLGTSSNATGISIQNQGGGAAHSHTFTSSAFQINTIDMILCSRN